MASPSLEVVIAARQNPDKSYAERVGVGQGAGTNGVVEAGRERAAALSECNDLVPGHWTKLRESRGSFAVGAA